MIKMVRKILLFFLLGGCVLCIEAQSPLKINLSQAIERALDKNLNIKISNRNLEISEHQLHHAMAGWYPSLQLNGSWRATQSNTDIQFVTDPAPQEGLASESLNKALRLDLNYMIFNGLGRFYQSQKLKTQRESSEVIRRIEIENIIMRVIQVFFNLQTAKELSEYNQLVLERTRDNFSRVEIKNRIGAASDLDLLNAQLFANNDSSQWLTSKYAYERLEDEFKSLLQIDQSEQIDIFWFESADYTKLTDDSLENLNASNPQILLALSELDRYAIEKKAAYTRFAPMLMGNLSYGFNSNESTPSVVLFNESIGLTAGLTLSWDLFDGLKRKKALEVAKLSYENSSYKQQEATEKVRLEYTQKANLYHQTIQLLEIQQQSMILVEKRLNNATVLFESGSIDAFRHREYQLEAIQSKFKALDLERKAALYYYDLQRLRGTLLIEHF